MKNGYIVSKHRKKSGKKYTMWLFLESVSMGAFICLHTFIYLFILASKLPVMSKCYFMTLSGLFFPLRARKQRLAEKVGWKGRM